MRITSMTSRKPLISEKNLLTKSPQEIRRLVNSRKNSPQDRADCAIVTTIEAIQHIAEALNNAAIAIMYHIPAKFAEPQRGLDWVYRTRESLLRALSLLRDRVQKPSTKKRHSKLRTNQEKSHD
jgi:hypothetical protein